MYSINEIREITDNAIKQIHWSENMLGLYAPADYMMQMGGKRIRPMLTLLAADSFSGDIVDATVCAMAMEVFHNFTLVHDDIMDDAPVRRGKPTVHTNWDISTAILSGDAMLIKAYTLLCETNSSSLPQILRIFNKTATEVCEGQRMDMDFEKLESVSVEQYLEMIRLKTSVLLGCCLYSGAKIANADEFDAQKLFAFGEFLGLSFQIQDDILDTWGNAKTFGKKTGGDILRNKKTFLSIKTMELADAGDKEKLLQYFSTSEVEEEEKLNFVITMYQKYNVKEIANGVMEKYYYSALSSLQAIELAEEKKVRLKEFAQSIYDRNF